MNALLGTLEHNHDNLMMMSQLLPVLHGKSYLDIATMGCQAERGKWLRGGGEREDWDARGKGREFMGLHYWSQWQIPFEGREMRLLVTAVEAPSEKRRGNPRRRAASKVWERRKGCGSKMYLRACLAIGSSASLPFADTLQQHVKCPESSVTALEHSIFTIQLSVQHPSSHEELYNHSIQVPSGSSLLDVLGKAQNQGSKLFT